MDDLKNKKFKTNPDILCEREKDGMLLFNPETGEVKILNESGAFIFGLINESCECGQIIARLAEAFEGCSHDQVTGDVLELVCQLQKAGLIKEIQQEAG